MTESGWLIENRDRHSPRWLTVAGGIFGWTPDSLKAIRFRRRSDAEQVAEVIGDEADLITEHAWGDSRDESSMVKIIETARIQIANKELFDADLTLQLALKEIS